MIQRTALTLAAALVAASAFAQTNVGVVNIDAVIQQSAKGKAALATIEDFRARKQDELQAMVKQYQDKQQEAQAMAASLSDDKRRELSAELQSMQTNLQRAREDAQREGQRRTNEVLEDLDRQLGPLVSQVAQAKNLQLVLQLRPELGIVFVDPAIDITADVIARFDASEE